MLQDLERCLELLSGTVMAEYTKRILWRSFIVTFAIVLFLMVYVNFDAALATFFGSLLATANLLLLRPLLKEILITKNPLKIALFFLLKFPLLYGAGYLIFASGLPILYVALGLGVMFPVLSFNLKPAASLLLLFFLPLEAGLNSDVPEVPNFITLLSNRFYETPWIQLLHEWESVFFSVFVAFSISTIFYFGTRKQELIPSGLQNMIEWVVENLRKFVKEVLGEEGEKYVPFLGTMFIYILVMNLMVLVPFMKAATSSLNITVALAICVFVLVQYLNIKHQGVKGFLFHLMGSPKDTMGWIMSPLMFVIELLTQFTRPVTLALRLFGNVLGEDILIGAFALFGVLILASIDWPLGLPLQLPFFFLSLLTSTMQALVFTLLSAIYILLSMPNHEEH